MLDDIHCVVRSIQKSIQNKFQHPEAKKTKAPTHDTVQDMKEDMWDFMDSHLLNQNDKRQTQRDHGESQKIVIAGQKADNSKEKSISGKYTNTIIMAGQQ